MSDLDSAAKDPVRHERTDQERERAERRERIERAHRFAAEIETWPSWKLRAAYAQPETVRRAEERERSQRAPEQR